MVSLVEEYVSNLIRKAVPAKFCFHCLGHTADVVKAVQLIGQKENVGHAQLQTLVTAAWFHDTGIVNGYENHEERSMIIAMEFLAKNGFSKKFIKEVNDCITATKLPQNPKGMLGAILCDADLFHLSQPEYWIKNELLRKEVINCKNMCLPDEVWLTQNLSFLNAHKYFTDYGRRVLESLKQKHIQENINQLHECLNEKN